MTLRQLMRKTLMTQKLHRQIKSLWWQADDVRSTILGYVIITLLVWNRTSFNLAFGTLSRYFLSGRRLFSGITVTLWHALGTVQEMWPSSWNRQMHSRKWINVSDDRHGMVNSTHLHESSDLDSSQFVTKSKHWSRKDAVVSRGRCWALYNMSE